MDFGKLGCNLTPQNRLKTVPFVTNYLTLPLISDSCDYVKRMNEPWGMLGNDRYGDCVFAAFAHLCQGMSANATGKARQFTDKQVLDWYSAVTGFDPDDPGTDQGTFPIDALNYLYRIGEIEAYGRVDPMNDAHVAAAIELFGGLYTAWYLPSAWSGKEIWDVGPNTDGPWRRGSGGGHMMSQHGYDGATNTPTVTWGDVVTITAKARHIYCDEAYVLVTKDWLDAKGSTLQGFDLDGLKARLTLVG
jgi:hypothetical protein